ncbi:MAG: hypothetical protein R2748_18235 [Bryobacterales bacterium]
MLAEGVDFRWETFREYLDVLEETPRIMDVGTQIPHAALRFYVMGEGGADHAARSTEDEIARIGVLIEEGLEAGAFGFSTSRRPKHRAADTPGYRAEINLIDFDEPQPERPVVVYGLPTRGKRISQRSRGYRHAFVRGVEWAGR